MKQKNYIRTILILFAFIIIYLNTKTVLSQSNDKIALVIGINSYINISKLNAATNDALIMGNFLKGKNFQVCLVNESYKNFLKKKCIIRFMNSLVQNKKRINVFLFYFSGHGIMYSNKTYLCMIDFDKNNIEENSICIEDELIPIIEELNAEVSILFFDACRNRNDNIRVKATNNIISDSRVNLSKRQIITFYSTQKYDYSMPKNDDSNGCFTHFLLKGLQKEYMLVDIDKNNVITGDELFDYIKNGLNEYYIQTNGVGMSGIQQPTYNIVKNNIDVFDFKTFSIKTEKKFPFTCIKSPWYSAKLSDTHHTNRMCSYVYNNYIYSIGTITNFDNINGCYIKNYKQKIELFDAKNNRWENLTNCPFNGFVEYFGKYSVNQLIVFLSTTDCNIDPSKNVYIYNIIEKIWEKKENLPFTKSKSGAVQTETDIYFISGYEYLEGKFILTNKSRKYSLQNYKWDEISPIPRARAYSTAITYKNKIYVIGGSTSGWREKSANNSVSFVDIYDISNNTWQTAADLPIKAYNLSAFIYNNELHVYGGKNKNGYIRLKYILSDNKWERLIDSDNNLSETSVVTLNNSIFFIGGHEAKRVLVYTPNE